MRYLPVNFTLRMFQHFCLKHVSSRSIKTGCFSCLYITMPNSSKTSFTPPRVKFFNDSIRYRIQNMAQASKKIVTTTNLGEMRNAPTNYFWLNMVGAAAFVTPPVLSLIGGYSPLLNGLELGYSAMYLSFLGGMNCMYYILEKDITWDRLRRSALPPAIAVTSLLLPITFGYSIIIVGMLLSLYRDIIFNVYAPWGNAVHLFVTTIAVISIFLMLIGHILFG